MGYVSTLLKIQAAFEQAGIQFIDDDETGGFGLRMAKKKRKDDLVLSSWIVPRLGAKGSVCAGGRRRTVTIYASQEPLLFMLW